MGDWNSQCWYLTSSINDHLNYFNLHESCDEEVDWIVVSTASPTVKPTAHINATESTQNEAAVTDVHRLENDSDSISNVLICIAAAVGCALALMFAVCWYRARMDLQKRQRMPSVGSYVSLTEPAVRVV